MPPLFQLRLALDHVRRRRPDGPFALVGDVRAARPLEARTSDPDPVARRQSARLNMVQIAVRRIDDDRAGLFVRSVFDHLPDVARIEARQVGGRDRECFLRHRPVHQERVVRMFRGWRGSRHCAWRRSRRRAARERQREDAADGAEHGAPVRLGSWSGGHSGHLQDCAQPHTARRRALAHGRVEDCADREGPDRMIWMTFESRTTMGSSPTIRVRCSSQAPGSDACAACMPPLSLA